MLHDARSLQTGTILDYDICIIGAGAAGITLALELSGYGRRICLLESGSDEFDPDIQAMYAGASSEPFPDIETSRLRYLGGSTNHWGGSTQRFGPLDFARRDWMPHSGWPITRADLDPFYDRAHAYLELPPPDQPADAILRQTDLKPFPLIGEKVRYHIGLGSPPTRFGEVYRPALEAAADIDVYLNANITEIAAAADGQSIKELQCAVLHGDRFTARAPLYVLATGGIENARLLLASRSVHADGLGNAHDVVGRYFLDHAVIGFGILQPMLTPARMAQFIGIGRLPSSQHGAYLELTEAEVTRRRTGGMRIPFEPISRYAASAGIESYHTLTDDWRARWDKGQLWDDIANILGDIDMVAEAISRRVFSTRLFDSANDLDFYFFDGMCEQQPDPDNRIVLQDARDALGLPRVRIEWRLTDLDRRTARENAVAFGEWLAAAGLGRLRLLLGNDRTWHSQISFGSHHSGATRMGDDPKSSVVDRNQRVHGLANLYVAGSSVFPTNGHVPVTLTIVATTIRLADHLKARRG
jgi:choline dehydrogenase-like flavoprotein